MSLSSLLVSLLSFWTLPTTARLAVETVPPLVAEGSVAVFNILEKEGLIIGYGWFRGNRVDQQAAIEGYQVIENSHTPGPANTGRETIKPNGSLIIQSVRKQDAGTYTVITVKADLTNVSASGQLQVYSECFLSDLGMLKGAVEFCFDRPGWRLHLPLHYVPCWGLNVQCRAHTVETNSKGSDFHSGDLGPADTAERRPV